MSIRSLEVFNLTKWLNSVKSEKYLNQERLKYLLKINLWFFFKNLFKIIIFVFKAMSLDLGLIF